MFYSFVIRTTCSNWTCFEQQVELGGLHRPPPTYVVLYFVYQCVIWRGSVIGIVLSNLPSLS